MPKQAFMKLRNFGIHRSRVVSRLRHKLIAELDQLWRYLFTRHGSQRFAIRRSRRPHCGVAVGPANERNRLKANHKEKAMRDRRAPQVSINERFLRRFHS